MRPGLLNAGSPAPLAERTAEDLGLSTVIDAMAAGDPEIAEAARSVLLAVPPGAETVAHRQAVLTDLQREPKLGRELYELAGRALDAQREAARAVFFATPETVLKRSVVTLTAFVPLLRELRSTAVRCRPRTSSAGLTAFFDMVESQLDEAYLSSVTSLLGELDPRGELLVSARLGAGNQSEDFAVLRPPPRARGLFRRGSASSGPTATYKIPHGDEAGQRASASLRDQALAGLAGTADRSTQHVLAFFATLRAEIAFYLGCLNLHAALTARGAPVCLPAVDDAASRRFSVQGLYDPGLQLRLGQPVAANDLSADGRSLIMVTGANRGGKSTFLRSVGLAQLMAAAGMFVAAVELTTAARTGMFTHFTQDEDNSSKFDEELRRMSELAGAVGPDGLLLCNESFQSTNEREGSAVARQLVDALTEAGVTVVFVTHLHELASSCYEDRDRFPALFLRADRDRSFRLHEAPPKASSHGADLWNRLRRHS